MKKEETEKRSFYFLFFKTNENFKKWSAYGREKSKLSITPRTQDANWTYIRRSEDVLCTFNIYPVPRGGKCPASNWKASSTKFGL